MWFLTVIIMSLDRERNFWFEKLISKWVLIRHIHGSKYQLQYRLSLFQSESSLYKIGKEWMCVKINFNMTWLFICFYSCFHFWNLTLMNFFSLFPKILQLLANFYPLGFENCLRKWKTKIQYNYDCEKPHLSSKIYQKMTKRFIF